MAPNIDFPKVATTYITRFNPVVVISCFTKLEENNILDLTADNPGQDIKDLVTNIIDDIKSYSNENKITKDASPKKLTKLRNYFIKQCEQSAQFKILLASSDIETMTRYFLSNVKHVGRWKIESKKLAKTISSFLPCLTEKGKLAIDEEGRNDLGVVLSTIVEVVHTNAHQRDDINNEVRVMTLLTQFWKGTNQKFLPAIVDWATEFDSRHKSFRAKKVE